MFRVRAVELRLSHFKEPAAGGVVKSWEGLSTVKVKTVHFHRNSLSVNGFAIEESSSYIPLKTEMSMSKKLNLLLMQNVKHFETLMIKSSVSLTQSSHSMTVFSRP